MIVDDEWPALEQMRELLLKCDGVGSVDAYDNPREALAAAAERRPDILFLDIQMPELSGLAFAEKLQPYSPETDIVFVTAYRSYAVEAFELSAADYLLKPVDPSRLLKTWNKVLAKRRLTAAGRQPQHAATFRFLGDYSASGPHGNIKWSTHKAEELFAYLWIHRQGSVNVILNEVFPQWDYAKGKQYLHTTVYQIRKTLKKAELEQIELSFDRENYRLEPRGIAGDIDRFREAAAEAFQSGSLEHLRAAVELYSGELLPGMDSLWVYPVRDKVRQTFLKLLEGWTGALIEAGRYQEAEEYADRLVTEEPLEESYTLQLISVYYKLGKPLKAQRRFTQFRDSYTAEMGDELPEWFMEAYRGLGRSTM
ncbi:response regulator [Paenibacillus tepidiphilus]|uniref:response regulator n=1 Tax=Paenibacillus tepidiphilus TaxID=2608683 RepID=UPI00123BDE79|nr:response regulator [Paenibacillus tepidiphilus]